MATGLIDVPTLLGISDRAASQYLILYNAFDQLTQTGGGLYWQRVTATNNPDVEIPCEANYRAVDEGLNVDTAVANGTNLATIIGSMEVHFNLRCGSSNNPLQPGGWNGYGIDQDVRYSWWFNKLWNAVKGSWMLAVNVFSETDDQFGEVTVVPGPNLTYVDGINYGNGAIANPADGAFFAATQLKAVVTNKGPNDLFVRLFVKDVNDDPTLIDVTIPANSPPGTEIPIGTSSDRFLDVFGVALQPPNPTGAVGDIFTVRNLKERQIAL